MLKDFLQWLTGKSKTRFVVKNGVTMPIRSTKYAAGYDFFLPRDIIVQPNSSCMVDTGVRVKLKKDQFLELHPRSSLAAKGLVLQFLGIIDSDYFNSGNTIKCYLKNTSDKAIEIKQGDRYMQGIVKKYYILDKDSVKKHERTGGFGSTNH